MSNTSYGARQAALSVLDGFQVTPTSLISYQSSGRVVVIGDQNSLACCQQWSNLDNLVLISTTEESMPASSNGVIHLRQRDIQISGYLGAFVVELVDANENLQTLHADVVLDLSPEVINRQQLLPPGYIHTHIDSENLNDVEAQLDDLVGEFDKPRYFDYDPSICAHSVNGKTVCKNCIDACPAGAIESAVDGIQVSPYLCQGGGSCATVCPSGAIRYVYPQLADSGNQLRKMLKEFHDLGGTRAIIMFHSETDFPDSILETSSSILPFGVEELASVGPDLCLSALVYGASQVVLLSSDQIPAKSLTHLNRQIDWLQLLLDGLGLNSQLIGLQAMSSEFAPQPAGFSIEPAIYSMPNGKRNAIFQAIDHLYQQAERTRELVSLPVGAPFGAASIDEMRCTLCMACVGACPGKALQDGSNREIPEIFFIESNCIQCGACTYTCPEDAIAISPRMIFDREPRNASRSLNQDVPFGCIQCGKPFAPTSVIQKMQDKLKDHYMFDSNRALDRLKMCEDCRVADIVQDPEALKGNFDPLN